MPTVTDNLTVNARQAGEILDLTSQAVINRIEGGKLPAEKDGHQWKIPITAVQRQKDYEEFSEKMPGLLQARMDVIRWGMLDEVMEATDELTDARQRFENAAGAPSDLDGPGEPWRDVQDAVQNLREVLFAFVSVEDERGREAARLAMRQALRRLEHDADDAEQPELFDGDGGE